MAQGFKIADIYAELRVESKMEKGLGDARQALAAMNAEIQRLKSESKLGVIDTADAAARIRTLQAEIAKLQGAMKGANDAMSAKGVDAVGMALGKGASSARNFGFALMQMSAIVDDAQYGLQGIVNNIGPLVTALTGNMGAGAAAQVAAVGIAQLARHWDDLMALFGRSTMDKSAKAYIDSLAASLSEAAVQSRALQMAEEHRQKSTAAMTHKDEEEAPRAKAYEEAIDRAGRDKVVAGLGAVMPPVKLGEGVRKEVENQILAENPGLRASYNVWSAITGGKGDIASERVKELTDQRLAEMERAETKRTAGNLLNQAQGTGPGAESARAQLKQLVKDNPELFPQHTLAELKAAESTRTKTDQALFEQEEKMQGQGHDADRDRAAALAQQLYNQSTPLGMKLGGWRQRLLGGGEGFKGNPEDEIKAQLMAQGMGANDSKRLAPLILGQLERDVKDEVRKRAAKEGVTEDVARERILKEDAESRERRKEDAAMNVTHARERQQSTLFAYHQAMREHYKPQFTNLTDYAKKLTVGGYETDKWQQQQLEMSRQNRDATRAVKKAIEDQERQARYE